jgi:hypothetical protein
LSSCGLTMTTSSSSSPSTLAASEAASGTHTVRLGVDAERPSRHFELGSTVSAKQFTQGCRMQPAEIRGGTLVLFQMQLQLVREAAAAAATGALLVAHTVCSCCAPCRDVAFELSNIGEGFE